MSSVPSHFTHPLLRRSVLALAGLAAIGCSGQGQDLVAPTTEPALAVIEQPADIFETLGVVSAPWGTATIRRASGGVQVKLRVTDPAVQTALEGDAITVWMASFNNPGACTVPNDCVPADLGKPATGAFLQRVGGQVLGSGPITLAVNAREGDTTTQFGGTADGMIDAENDEIHVIIRSHGAPIPGKVAAQISTLSAGCKTVNGGPGPDPEGNDCVQYVAIFF